MMKSLTFVLMFQLLVLSLPTDELDTGFLSSSCDSISANKTKDPTYEANVKALLSDLISNSTTQGNGFYTSFVGKGTPNFISGRILCRGDVTPSTCKQCVTLAAKKVLSDCPNATNSTIYYDLCMLHYTSMSFPFDSLIPGGFSWSTNKTEITDESRFNQTVWDLFRVVTEKASYNSTAIGKKFAVDEVPVTTTLKLYGLAQCMPDLTVSQCSMCFQTAILQLLDCDENSRKRGECCCAESTSASVFMAGCNVRYDTHRFSNVSKKVSNVPEPHPTSPHHSPDFLSSSCGGLGHNNITKNDTYEANVKTLLSDLIANSTTQGNGFYISVVGWGTPYSISGRILCRGDVTPSTCKRCVTLAAKQVLSFCPNGAQSTAYYDLCMLHYTSESFQFDGLLPDSARWSNNKTGISDERHFNQTVWDLFRLVTAKAAYNSTSTDKKFATDEIPVTATQKLYGLAQCMPDLTVSQCSKCFQTALRQVQDYYCDEYSRKRGECCCAESPSASFFVTGCIFMYDTNRFYNVSSMASNIAKAHPTPRQLLPPGKQRRTGSPNIVLIVAPIIISVMLFCLSFYLPRRKQRKSEQAFLTENFGEESSKLQSLKFNLTTIEAATNKFSPNNTIGKGGFGDVYKGILHDGQEIAVKRLSKNSIQGASEFKNEVLLIAKLQHKNLVTLLGFCVEEQEKILVYEYVPNKSIDYFLFDTQNQRQLNWLERYQIICGIAQGLLYLHEHSRLKVIHRDLKPSNVLLDSKMNPKISDFGMARMVVTDQDQENTNRIVGTYGYMSPEYLMYGQFSEKSDVFSFGVIILEMISSKRNAKSYESHLLTYAWKQWNEGTPLHVLDSGLLESCSQTDVTRCLQIGLLCVKKMQKRGQQWLKQFHISVILPLNCHLQENPHSFCKAEKMEVKILQQNGMWIKLRGILLCSL